MSNLIWSLLLFGIVVVFTPGANNLLAATSGAQFGLRASAGLLLGLGSGVVSLVIITAVGLGSLVTSVPQVQTALRIAGTVYLIWLAAQIARSEAPDTGHAPADARGFRAGLMVSWLNPKVWMLGVSAVAGYSALSSNPLVLATILGAVFLMLVPPNLVLWCSAGQVIAKKLSTDRQWRILNITLAALLV